MGDFTPNVEKLVEHRIAEAIEALARLITGSRLPVDASGLTVNVDMADTDVKAITGDGAGSATLGDLKTALEALRTAKSLDDIVTSIDALITANILTNPQIAAANWASHRTAITVADTAITYYDTPANMITAFQNQGAAADAITITGSYLEIMARTATDIDVTGTVVFFDANNIPTKQTFTLTKTGLVIGSGGTDYQAELATAIQCRPNSKVLVFVDQAVTTLYTRQS